MDTIGQDITEGVFEERETDRKHPTYDSEMGFYNLIAEGKTEEAVQRWRTGPRSDDQVRGTLSENPLRNAQYHFVAMVTIVTRVCISHGMDQDLAYKTSDTFIRRADRLTTPSDVRSLQEQMIVRFSEMMTEQGKGTVNSRKIIQCLDYINEHLHENITVSELAEEVGLNETYLSKLFRKQTGYTVSEYVRKKKIEEACWLLRFTDKTSIEIAADLAFSSHSYFISVFRKVTNMTPKEYRDRNARTI